MLLEVDDSFFSGDIYGYLILSQYFFEIWY